MISGFKLMQRTLLLVPLCTLMVITSLAAQPRDDAERFGGPFTLTAGDGSTKTDESFRGKWMLVYFGYTHCPNICPMTLSAISEALDILGPLADQVQSLYVSIDPERDTPAQMEEYTRNFDSRILGLTGTPEAIASVAKEYRVFYRKVPSQTPGEYWMEHSAFIYVMGPDGRYVTLISHSEPAAAIAERMRKLMTR